MKQKNALLINHSDVNEGGASFAGFNIFKGLEKYSAYDPFMLCAHKKSSEKNIEELAVNPNGNVLTNTIGKVKRKAYNHFYGGEYWSLQGENVFTHPFYQQADIVNVHNLHGENYFSYTALEKIVHEKPIVLTMQDMWYFTGHCAFSYDCRGYENGCAKCPHLDYYPALNYDNAAFHFKNKMELYRNKNVHFVSCSRWFADVANDVLRRNGIVKDVYHVNNPIETEDLFKLREEEKTALKRSHGIPLDKKIISFGAAMVYEPRKGLQNFLEILDKELVEKHNLFLVLIGNESFFDAVPIPSYLPYKSLGNLVEVSGRNLAYNISDLFVFPSLADDLPNMILETLCSELPVVCFDVGGNKEVVVSGVTGYLAANGDYKDFLNGMDNLLSLPEERINEIKKNARNIVMDNYSTMRCATQYEKIFDSALSTFASLL